MATDKLRSFVRTALTSPRRSIADDFGLAAFFFLLALLGRLAIDFSFAERLPYITYFPMLVLTSALCSFPASIAYVVISAITGSFWVQTPSIRIGAIVLYAIAAAAIVVLTESLKDAYRELQARDQELTLINGELKHRIRNLLQIANAIVGQTLDDSPGQRDMKTAVTGRLRALGNAQSLITLSPSDVPISEVIDVTLGPLAPAHDRFVATGPRVYLPAKVITMLSLVLYELGTNALKYGAWSDARGGVSLDWVARDGKVTVEWRERDGPPINMPGKLGAGTKLIRTAIPNAAVHYRLESDGARCTIEMPVDYSSPRPFGRG